MTRGSRSQQALVAQGTTTSARVTRVAGASCSPVSAAPRKREPASAKSVRVWLDICDQFGLQLLVLAEQLRASLDELEAAEDDPVRLHRLYQVDHAVTRMRRASRDLRTLAGRFEGEPGGIAGTTSLLDVVRMSISAIERYPQVSTGQVTGLGVPGYAADDLASLLAALLDNATRYSTGTVTVSAHLVSDGGAMFRIEDTGAGMGADEAAALNATFAGPVREVDELTGRHSGFPVVHRIARKHSLAVRFAARSMPSTGTVAMVTVPPQLLCEVPAVQTRLLSAQTEPTGEPPAPAEATEPVRAVPAGRASAVSGLPRRERGERGSPVPAREVPAVAEAAAAADPGKAEPVNAELLEGEPGRAEHSGELPRRQRAAEPGNAAPGNAGLVTAEPGTAEHSGELPRRQRAVRAAEPRPARRPAVPPQQQAAARRSFAADVGAFAEGSSGSPGDITQRPRNGVPVGGEGMPIEEGATP